MKPSERIQELLDNDKSDLTSDIGIALRLIYAITDYLDEEWEKSQPPTITPLSSATFIKDNL